MFKSRHRLFIPRHNYSHRLRLTFFARSYGNLESKGAKIVWGDFSEGVGKLVPEGESFDYVFDNYAKDVATCEDLAGCAKAWYVPGCMVSAGGGETMMARDTLIRCC